MKRTLANLALCSTLFAAGCETIAAAPEAAAETSAGVGLEAGYHYPAPQGVETATTIVSQAEKPPFEVRVQIVTAIATANAARPYPPVFFSILEGAERDTLVLLDMGGANIDTVYKARGLVSEVSALMRNNPLFSQYGVENYASIFDMLKIWGFEKLVITNGDDFAHAFLIE
ncbi:MAG: hypothetical protein AAGB25_01850 [Pseudomonadota bacterium]